MPDERTAGAGSPGAQSVEWIIEVGDDRTHAAFERATTPEPVATFVCAHGAGGHMADKSLLAVTRALRDVGFDIVRFNFIYREKRSSRPDPMPRLEACIEAVAARVRTELEPRRLIIGGRSMGGRAASMLAARGFDCEGLLLLAYPLHPTGRPEQLRVAHLADITVPVLCLNGTRDPLCTVALMERSLGAVQTDWTMHWLTGADHSFHVLKSSGRTDADVLAEAARVSRTWAERLWIG